MIKKNPNYKNKKGSSKIVKKNSLDKTGKIFNILNSKDNQVNNNFGINHKNNNKDENNIFFKSNNIYYNRGIA